MQDRLRDKVHLQTVQILEREDALTPRMEEAGGRAATPHAATAHQRCGCRLQLNEEN